LDTIFKHFYQAQHKDTTHIQPPPNLPFINLDIKECNPDKDIIATTPTIQIDGTNAHLYDETGKYIYTIFTQRLQWLWKQYIQFKNK
jgi:hypothetical protein